MEDKQRMQASSAQKTARTTRRQAKEAKRVQEQRKKEISIAGLECDRFKMKKINLERQLEEAHRPQWEKRLRAELAIVESQLSEAQAKFFALKATPQEEMAKLDENTCASDESNSTPISFEWIIAILLGYVVTACLLIAYITFSSVRY